MEVGGVARGYSRNHGLGGSGHVASTSRGLAEARGDGAQPGGGRCVLAAPAVPHAVCMVASGGSHTGSAMVHSACHTVLAASGAAVTSALTAF